MMVIYRVVMTLLSWKAWLLRKEGVGLLFVAIFYNEILKMKYENMEIWNMEYGIIIHF